MGNRARTMTPADWARLGTSWWLLMAETQAVMTMRVLGMAGVWSVTPAETRRMIAEKAPAVAASATAAGRAMLAGQSPDRIALAAIKPLRRKTGSNTRRLARRGPKPLH